MGYYINQTSKGTELPAKGKAKALIADGATQIEPSKLQYQPNLVCVVENGSFDAAGYVYSPNEFKEWNDSSDDRPKTWLTHPDAVKLSGY